MSAILAVVGPAAPGLSDADVSGLLDGMRRRGADERATWRAPDGAALLAVARDRWELDPGIGGAARVATSGRFTVVSDASLYYQRELDTRLRSHGVSPAGPAPPGPADRIAAACEAFGPGSVDHLEGDYAFCAWDADSRTLFCARDPFGARSLFHTTIGNTLFVASTAHPLVRRQGRAAGFEPEGVLRAILMRYGDGAVTAWKGVRELPAGHSLRARRGNPEIRRFWRAAGSERWRSLDPTEAVNALPGLLSEAASARHHAGGTALALSGGQDSTAILASLRPGGASDLPLHLLSFRLPEDDPGNEAWYVERTARAFGLPVHWVDIARLGFFDDVRGNARLRSHCHGHLFEPHNRAIAGTARSLDDRVLLNGHGGDNVFAVGNAFLADLFRSGRWWTLRRQMAARQYRGLRPFLTHCLRPALPPVLFDALEPILRRRICSRPFERPVPGWVTADEALLQHVSESDRRHHDETILRQYSTVDLRLRAWGLMDPAFHRACADLFDSTRDEGVELRLPLYDPRLVEFTLSRPPRESNQPGRYKVLLQKAMHGRVPERSRGPEPGGLKPGTAVGVVRSRWPREAAAFASSLEGPWISEELGVVDAGRFREALESGAALEWWAGVDAGITLFVEAWLRANAGT